MRGLKRRSSTALALALALAIFKCIEGKERREGN